MLGSRIEEQERMIELVRQGACKRVLQEMDEKAVQKMRPEQVADKARIRFVKAYGQEWSVGT